MLVGVLGEESVQLRSVVRHVYVVACLFVVGEGKLTSRPVQDLFVQLVAWPHKVQT